MAIKIYKPTSPGRRIHSVTDYSVLDKRVKTPKNLIVAFKKNAGRNNQGKITVRHQGGGHRLKARVVDFLRTDKLNIPAKVQTLEYDPTRSGFISLLAYRDGEKRYILAPDGLKVGSEIVAAPRTDVSAGNRMMLRNIPVGTYVHNVQIDRTQGSSVARSAGSYAIIVATEGESTLLKFPSGEIRKVSSRFPISIGCMLGSARPAECAIWAGGRPCGVRP